MANRVWDYYEDTNEIRFQTSVDGFTELVTTMSDLFGAFGPSTDHVAQMMNGNLTLEDVMNFFYLQHHLLGDNQSRESSYTKTLNNLLAFVLAESLKGPPCDKHAKLAKKIEAGDLVLNFNYDLLMDNALSNAGKLTDAGYLLPFNYSIINGSWKTSDGSPSQIKLLKLHGSLNWLRCSSCGSKLLLRNLKSVEDLWDAIMDLSSVLSSEKKLRCPNCPPDMKSSLERIIIPPAGIKNFQDPEIRFLWRVASLADFQSMKDIYVIGYRFSDIDYELEVLLRSIGGDRNRQLRDDAKVTIVNPNPDPIGKRFSVIFSEKNIQKPFLSLDDFLAN